MFCWIVCFFKDHRWRAFRSIFHNRNDATSYVCDRCGAVDWGDK